MTRPGIPLALRSAARTRCDCLGGGSLGSRRVVLLAPRSPPQTPTPQARAECVRGGGGVRRPSPLALQQTSSQPARALGSERGRHAAAAQLWAEKGTCPVAPKVLSSWTHCGPQSLMSRQDCQSQGLRTGETGAPGGKGSAGTLVQDPCPGPRGWRPPAVLRVLWALLTTRQPGRGLRKDAQGGHFPPPLSGNVTVMRVQTASDFIFPRTDGETEARGGKVCPLNASLFS